MNIGVLGRRGFAFAALALAIGSCGRAADEIDVHYDSNTNWLRACASDGECSGTLRCHCGQCTLPCSQSDECALLEGAGCTGTTAANCGEQAGAGGMCVLECTFDADCGSASGFRCAEGQCVPRPCGATALHDWDGVLEAIADDLAARDEDSEFSRYLYLAGAADQDACSGPLETERQAMDKLLNSLSLDSRAKAAVPIDPARRVFRVDLRDYQWDRPIVARGQAYDDVWEALVDGNPYAVAHTGDDADEIVAATGEPVSLMLASTFIAQATEPERYRAILDLPDTLDELFEALGIDSGHPAAHAGFVAGVPFVARRWDIERRSGSLWQIAEYRGEAEDLFANPTVLEFGERELVFTLPNGLYAFTFVGADGLLLANEWSISGDPAEGDGVARIPRSSLRRHAQDELNVRDEIIPFVRANAERFDPALTASIDALYPGPDVIEQLVASDATLPARALRSIDVDPDAADPITRQYASFLEPVTLSRAAQELLLQPDELLRDLAQLPPVLSELREGTLTRAQFSAVYREAACLLGQAAENRPLCD